MTYTYACSPFVALSMHAATCPLCIGILCLLAHVRMYHLLCVCVWVCAQASESILVPHLHLRSWQVRIQVCAAQSTCTYGETERERKRDKKTMSEALHGPCVSSMHRFATSTMAGALWTPDLQLASATPYTVASTIRPSTASSAPCCCITMLWIFWLSRPFSLRCTVSRGSCLMVQQAGLPSVATPRLSPLTQSLSQTLREPGLSLRRWSSRRGSTIWHSGDSWTSLQWAL